MQEIGHCTFGQLLIHLTVKKYSRLGGNVPHTFCLFINVFFSEFLIFFVCLSFSVWIFVASVSSFHLLLSLSFLSLSLSMCISIVVFSPPILFACHRFVCKSLALPVSFFPCSRCTSSSIYNFYLYFFSQPLSVPAKPPISFPFFACTSVLLFHLEFCFFNARFDHYFKPLNYYRRRRRRKKYYFYPSVSVYPF